MIRWLAVAALALGCTRPRPSRDASVDRPVVARDVVAVLDAPSVDAPDVPPARARRATVTLGGDIVLTAPVLREAMSRRESGRLVALLGPVAPLLAFQTIGFANLRAPLGSPATLQRAPGGAPVELARDLARVGFDVLQVANDRIGDLGAPGLRDTLDALRGADVLAPGLHDGDEGPFAPAIVERGRARRVHERDHPVAS
ncbi:MAG: CapA family protein [Polyangiales bacterium]